MIANQLLTIRSATLTPADDEVLGQWSSSNLDACEEWLIRRHLGPPPAILAKARSEYAHRLPDKQIMLALRRLSDRRARVLPDSSMGILIDLAERLAHDLPMYADSLTAAGFEKLQIAVTNTAITPLYLPSSKELFLPRWLVPAVPHHLFAPTPLLPNPPMATVSWIFFQSLTLVADRNPIPTLAQFCEVMEC